MQRFSRELYSKSLKYIERWIFLRPEKLHKNTPTNATSANIKRPTSCFISIGGEICWR